MSAEIRATILGSLKSQLLVAKTKLAVGGWLSPTSSASAIGGALAFDQKQVDRLSPSGDLGRAVVAGTLTHSRWVSIAKLTWDDVAAQMKYLGAAMPTWSRVWDEVVTPTASDVATKAGAVADATPYVLVLAVVAVVAIAVLRVA